MAAADGQLPGRVLYDVGSPDALAHWLAQHPYVVMLAGSSHLDTYLDTATGALLPRARCCACGAATARPTRCCATCIPTRRSSRRVNDGGLPEGGAIDARVRALAGREQIGTVRTVMTRRRRFVLMARRDWDTEITIDSAVVTAHGMLPARHVTCEVVALRTRPLDAVFLDALERAGELRAGAPEPWERGTGRPEPAQPARPDLGHEALAG